MRLIPIFLTLAAILAIYGCAATTSSSPETAKVTGLTAQDNAVIGQLQSKVIAQNGTIATQGSDLSTEKGKFLLAVIAVVVLLIAFGLYMAFKKDSPVTVVKDDVAEGKAGIAWLVAEIHKLHPTTSTPPATTVATAPTGVPAPGTPVKPATPTA